MTYLGTVSMRFRQRYTYEQLVTAMQNLKYSPITIKWASNYCFGSYEDVDKDGHSGGSMNYTSNIINNINQTDLQRWSREFIHFRDYSDLLSFSKLNGSTTSIIGVNFAGSESALKLVSEINEILGDEPSKTALLKQGMSHSLLTKLVKECEKIIN